MSYADIRGYIQLLHQQAAAGVAVNIHWPAINIAEMRAVAHAQLAGLQIADAAATSLFYGVRLGRYGIADPSYMQFLRGHSYRHKGNRFGYGVKFLSNFSTLKEKMPHLSAAFQDW